MPSKDANTFATVAIQNIIDTRNTYVGKLFAHSTGITPSGEQMFDGLLHLEGGGVYRLGMMTEGNTIRGWANEHRTQVQQEQEFLDALADAGLSPEKAEAARKEVQAIANEAGPPREITVKAAQLEAIAERLESGQCDAGLQLIRKILRT
jgi:hypothetical protein